MTAKCKKQCDTCFRVTAPTFQRNCSNFGSCPGKLKKYDQEKDQSRHLIAEIAKRDSEFYRTTANGLN